MPGASFGDIPVRARALDPGMGIAVARRTVFRDGDNECFGRVADRVAAGNMALLGRQLTLDEQSEKARLRNAIATGALLTSGRHLQHGDETQPDRPLEVFTNCATAIASFAKFYLLLNGSGVGRSYDDALLAVDWHAAPRVLLYLSKDHPDYPHTITEQVQLGKDLGILPADTVADPDGIMRRYLTDNLISDLAAVPADAIYHSIADSREGWAKALELLEAMAFRRERNETVVLDHSHIRRAGSPIAGMQDRPASGPVSLIRAFLNLRNHVINASAPTALWEQALRVDHHFSVEVQVGGARRAARMATKSWRDPDVLKFIRIKAEGGLWTANHSVMVDSMFWDLVRAPPTEQHLSKHAHAVFMEATRCAFINGEPGFINGDMLEDHRTGVAWQKPIHEDGRDFHSARYHAEEAKGLLAELARRAALATFPVTTNPCVTADTWVHTSDGPRQVQSLIDKPFTAIVDGKPYAASGFWKTGTKTVFRLTTDRGYEVRATGNHKFLVESRSDRYHSARVWKEMSDICPGDTIVLSNHKSLAVSTDRDVDFRNGWLVGQMTGDGGCATENFDAYVRFWGDERLGFAETAFDIVQKIPADYHERNLQYIPADNPSSDTITIHSKRLTLLAEGLVDANKVILPGLEMASTNFVRGFLRGFFDADGTVCSNLQKGTSVRLSQSDIPRLKAVQRMLSRLGILSTIYENRRPGGHRMLPNGRGDYQSYFCKANHELVISRSNIDRFSSLIGFMDWSKSAKLNQILDDRTRVAYRDMTTATVTGIDVDGFEAVFDCTVDEIHRFDANGIVAHNCGEVCLHVTGGYCVLADFAPLLACPVPLDSLIPGEVPHDIAALWDARVEDTIRLGVRFLLRANTMDALYGEEVARTNRIGIGPTGLHDFAWLRFGFDFNDLLDPAVSGPFWELLHRISAVGKEESSTYAKQLGRRTPVTVTTVKPAGTTAKLFGLTEGVHLPARRQYLRWVQFKGVQDPDSKLWNVGSDPLLAEYQDRGYPMRTLHSFQGMTIVGFPTVPLLMRLGIGYRSVTAGEASPIQQYEWLRLLERHWIGAEQGNQISYTLKVFTDRFDLDAFRTIVLENQPTVRCCAILPSKPDHELGFEYLPEEEVSLDRFADIVQGISDGEVSESIDLVHLQCASGACPV
jgi:hypothetical protein